MVRNWMERELGEGGVVMVHIPERLDVHIREALANSSTAAEGECIDRGLRTAPPLDGGRALSLSVSAPRGGSSRVRSPCRWW